MISIRPLLDGGNYGKIELDLDVPVLVFDHLGGFNIEQENELLEQLQDCTNNTRDVYCEYIFSDKIRNKYSKLNLQFDISLWKQGNCIDTMTIPEKPNHDFQNFLCTFNSNPHVSRKLLVSLLRKRGWFNEKYSTKQFAFHPVLLLGDLYDLIGTRAKWYSKFFIADESPGSDKWNSSVLTIGSKSPSHGINFSLLKESLSQSFVHVVSETMATSYYPFVTEKCFYSIANQGLFVAYAQPGWHKHLEVYFGFKKYNKIFDYSFDHIVNPVDRLLTLTDMLSKFANLNRFDWHDLWLVERDTIMHNYMHFAGGQYLYHLQSKLNLPSQNLIRTAINNF